MFNVKKVQIPASSMNMTFLCHSDTISLSNLFDLISHETCDKNISLVRKIFT